METSSVDLLEQSKDIMKAMTWAMNLAQMNLVYLSDNSMA